MPKTQNRHCWLTFSCQWGCDKMPDNAQTLGITYCFWCDYCRHQILEQELGGSHRGLCILPIKRWPLVQVEFDSPCLEYKQRFWCNFCLIRKEKLFWSPTCVQEVRLVKMRVVKIMSSLSSSGTVFMHIFLAIMKSLGTSFCPTTWKFLMEQSSQNHQTCTLR